MKVSSHQHKNKKWLLSECCVPVNLICKGKSVGMIAKALYIVCALKTMLHVIYITLFSKLQRFIPFYLKHIHSQWFDLKCSLPSCFVSIQHFIIIFPLFLHLTLLRGCFTASVFLFVIDVCVWVCVTVSGVFHYLAPQGRNSLLFSFLYHCGHCLLFGVKNNNKIADCTSRLLRFNCIRLTVWTESRRGKRGTNTSCRDV